MNMVSSDSQKSAKHLFIEIMPHNILSRRSLKVNLELVFLLVSFLFMDIILGLIKLLMPTVTHPYPIGGTDSLKYYIVKDSQK